MIGLWLLGGVVLAGGAVALDRMALASIRPPRKRHARSVRNLSLPAREHRFLSLGQDLTGWFVDPEEDEGGAVAVLVHGWGSSHGRMTFLAGPLLAAGHPTFLFDVRHHGESFDAPYVTVRHFRDDIRAAVAEARRAYPGRPMVLIGHSIGGAAAVLAVAEGAAVDGLITVGAPADLWSIWEKYFDGWGIPGWLVTRLLMPFWRYRAGESFRVLGPQERVKELALPFLILHGDRDESVPPRHARLLAEGGERELVILEGEGHNEILGNTRLHREALRFLKEVESLSSQSPAG
jgi:pimeloyl-ACP methyl ester carboxylesterase